ncbi:Hypothetical protein PHPALM_9250 [Phytophthora palmivora]|uniref:Uncharacterized protein n=1 Tax=Phytophthora palmivora TaxID=4796 RepID=A0A2P4Y7S5_9STRA|nr:Hypothetical protein PHPALM_9250 [Phytophthora palmivora]
MRATATEHHSHEDTTISSPSQPSRASDGVIGRHGNAKPSASAPSLTMEENQDQLTKPLGSDPSRIGVTIGDLITGRHEFHQDERSQHEDGPANVAAIEDALDRVRTAYDQGVQDPEQLLLLAEEAQPTKIRDAPFTIKAIFSENLQDLSRPKIIANLKLVEDNTVISKLLKEHAIVHLHKLPRNQLLFHVDSKQTKKLLEGQQCNLLGHTLEFERCDPLSDDYFVDVMGIQSQAIDRKVFQALVLMGCKPLYFNATYVNQETKGSSGILRYYVSGNVCPPNLLVKGNVCAQLLLDGVFYAVKVKDVPPHYYHVQPNRMSPHCLDLSKLPFGGHKKKSPKERKGNTKKTNQSGRKRDRPSEDQSTPQQHVDVADNDNSLDLSFDVNIEYEVSAPPSPEQFPSETFAHPPKRLQSRRSAPPPAPSSETNFWNYLAEIYPELECRETEPDDENNVGFQILVTNITPTKEVKKGGEYAFYHKPEKSKVRLSSDAITIRDLIPAMSTDISEAVDAFELECQTLKDVKKEKKEITKNRLGFSIRMSKLMRQKSNLIREFAQIHTWYRCVHASIPNGKNTFQTKWKQLIGSSVPRSREELFRIVNTMRTDMSESDDMLKNSQVLAFFELLLLTSAPHIFEKDYWIQTIATIHVPWLLASSRRLLHPNTLLALLRSECGKHIVNQLEKLVWSHDLLTRLIQLRNAEDWMNAETAVLQIENSGSQPSLIWGTFQTEC